MQTMQRSLGDCSSCALLLFLKIPRDTRDQASDAPGETAPCLSGSIDNAVRNVFCNLGRLGHIAIVEGIFPHIKAFLRSQPAIAENVSGDAGSTTQDGQDVSLPLSCMFDKLVSIPPSTHEAPQSRFQKILPTSHKRKSVPADIAWCLQLLFGHSRSCQSLLERRVVCTFQMVQCFAQSLSHIL